MNVNLPSLINNALDRHDNRNEEGESTRTTSNGRTSHRKHRNVAILSDNWTGGSMNHNDPSFLSSSFPRNPPKLFIASDDDDPDPAVVAAWRAEGFNVLGHIPLGIDADPTKTLRDLHRRAGLAPCETYGIVAFGEAASLCLEHFHVLDNNPELKLGLVVAYYPTRIPDPRTRFPSAVRGVVVHLALNEGHVGVVKQSQMVGIQGKRKVVKRRLPERGGGMGGRMEGEGWGGYEIWGYEADAGFAEEEAEEYDGICAELAWSRSLGVARGALLGMQNDGKAAREGLVDAFWEAKIEDQDLGDTMAVFSTQTEPSVTYVPTCTGGTGMDELEEFYSEYFLDGNPDSLDTTLLSRTVGTDRVVDEVFVTFKHSQEMPWILPGVPPTNKRVEIAIVSIVSFKGGKIQHEHVYWDQASVLMQVGLLKPNLVSQAGRKIGVERLPILGKTAARRVFGSISGVQDVEANELLYDLEDSEEEADRVDRRAERPKTLAERPKEPEQQPQRVVEVVSEDEEGEKGGSEKGDGEKGDGEKEVEEIPEEVEEEGAEEHQVAEEEVQQDQTEEMPIGEHMKKADEEKKEGELGGAMMEGEQLKGDAKKKSGKKRGGKKKNGKKEQGSWVDAADV